MTPRVVDGRMIAKVITHTRRASKTEACAMSIRRADRACVVDAIRTELALSAKVAREWTFKEASPHTRPTGVDPPPPPTPEDNRAAIAELKELLKNEQAVQLEAARRLAEQAKAAREAEKAAAAKLAEATKEARERARLEKVAEVERKRLEKEALREAREAVAALKAAEMAALLRRRERLRLPGSRIGR